jgi:hypothetical protein
MFLMRLVRHDQQTSRADRLDFRRCTYGESLFRISGRYDFAFAGYHFFLRSVWTYTALWK